MLRGGEPLEPERSVSHAFGAVIDAGPFRLTADYFRIRLSDRLALTRLFALSPAEVDGLLAEGVTSAGNLQNFRFFTNDFETRTQGLDLVATYAPPRFDGRTTFGFLFNYTGTTVTRFDPEVLDETRIRELQEAIPGTRWNATVRQALGRWSLLGRLSHYGEWFDSRDLYVYHGDAVVDLEAAYPVSESTTLSIGGRNVLGNDPEENPIARAKGKPLQRTHAVRHQRRVLLPAPKLRVAVRRLTGGGGVFTPGAFTCAAWALAACRTWARQSRAEATWHLCERRAVFLCSEGRVDRYGGCFLAIGR